MSSQVLEPRMPSLSSFWAVEKPFMVFSTMNACQCGSIRKGGVSTTLTMSTRSDRNAVLVGLHVSLGVDNQCVGVRAVGDPELAARQQVAPYDEQMMMVKAMLEQAAGNYRRCAMP